MIQTDVRIQLSTCEYIFFKLIFKNHAKNESSMEISFYLFPVLLQRFFNKNTLYSNLSMCVFFPHKVQNIQLLEHRFLFNPFFTFFIVFNSSL
jgi:hypothetical protein